MGKPVFPAKAALLELAAAAVEARVVEPAAVVDLAEAAVQVVVPVAVAARVVVPAVVVAQAVVAVQVVVPAASKKLISVHPRLAGALRCARLWMTPIPTAIAFH